MIVLNDEELLELQNNKRFEIKVQVQGYDVFELVTDGFCKGMYRVHGYSLEDVPELDDNDNVISVKKAGTYKLSIVRPKFIDIYCPFTRGRTTINVHDKFGNALFSVMSNTKLLYENDKYFWNIILVLI